MNTVAHFQGSTHGPVVRMLNSKCAKILQWWYSLSILDPVYLWKYVFKTLLVFSWAIFQSFEEISGEKMRGDQ